MFFLETELPHKIFTKKLAFAQLFHNYPTVYSQEKRPMSITNHTYPAVDSSSGDSGDSANSTLAETFKRKHRPLIMAILNVSPESFYKGSVSKDESALLASAGKAVQNGADLLDVGAMSTAPYKETQIPEAEEAKRMAWAVSALRREFPEIMISADTSRKDPAVAAFTAGANVLNDVHGLFQCLELGNLAVEAKADVVLMANESQLKGVMNNQRPERLVMTLLQGCLERARQAGIHDSRIILDPGIGFFRNTGLPWFEVDLALCQELPLLAELGFPLLVSVSRKSFIGKLLNREAPQERLAGSLAATLACIEGGAKIIRTHDVQETADAIGFWKLWKTQR